MKRVKDNQGGFTMIELIIVLAIMGILGAILVPSFISMRTNAKVTSDLTDIKTIDRLINTYFIAEGTKEIGTGSNILTLGSPLSTTSATLLDGADGALGELNAKGYVETTKQNLKTDGAGIGFDGTHLYLDVSDDIYKKYSDSGNNKGTWLR